MELREICRRGGEIRLTDLCEFIVRLLRGLVTDLLPVHPASRISCSLIDSEKLRQS